MQPVSNSEGHYIPIPVPGSERLQTFSPTFKEKARFVLGGGSAVITSLVYMLLLNYDVNFSFRWSTLMSITWAGFSVATWEQMPEKVNKHIARLALAILLNLGCDVTSQLVEDNLLIANLTIANVCLSGALILYTPLLHLLRGRRYW